MRHQGTVQVDNPKYGSGAEERKGPSGSRAERGWWLIRGSFPSLLPVPDSAPAGRSRKPTGSHLLHLSQSCPNMTTLVYDPGSPGPSPPTVGPRIHQEENKQVLDLMFHCNQSLSPKPGAPGNHGLCFHHCSLGVASCVPRFF